MAKELSCIEISVEENGFRCKKRYRETNPKKAKTEMYISEYDKPGAVFESVGSLVDYIRGCLDDVDIGPLAGATGSGRK